ncbi:MULTISPECIES: hypothetical protein [Sphingobacterium]|uniref:Uncharacterized protein n=1 Tax=Sphingobacterium multivorum TaxID=28454 RepID=A0A654DRN5_SPHMU|nr:MULTISPECIES: hypothetical protein [Sphingobacterium]HAF33473.1 hypothetical protein [Sphingobacterium sp.]OFV16434.1 hypothetical protein HMPREF3127_10415 [Sphingobacterium sp. HMSC13C05]QQT46243.1 hypothetical protein I6J00_06145 [Sphingobacterium multivorum]SUJ31705.1 Uncharacterised protein [Sphingobacterium multivorum]VXD07054.1 conserved hypothetical protein [Sphingobacterium multivorum]
MNDYTISLVPKVSRYVFDEVVVNDILKWLVSKDIVKAELSDCILGNLGFTFWNGPELKPEFIVALQ